MTWMFWVGGVLLVCLYIATGVISYQHGYSEGYTDAVYDVQAVLKEKGEINLGRFHAENERVQGSERAV